MLSDRELLESIQLDIAYLKRDASHDHDEIRELHCAVNGNGKVGLVQEMAIQKTKMALLFGLGGLLASAVIISLVAAILDLVVY